MAFFELRSLRSFSKILISNFIRIRMKLDIKVFEQLLTCKTSNVI